MKLDVVGTITNIPAMSSSQVLSGMSQVEISFGAFWLRVSAASRVPQRSNAVGETYRNKGMAVT
jgi:chemotaxis protein CheY-P-specific phosphatase CheC